MAIIDFFDRGWRIAPEGAAYIQDQQAYSYCEVGERSCRIAHALLGAGLPRYAKGAVWAGNDVLAWTCVLGLWRANMAWIPVNARNATDENQALLDAFDCDVVFYQQAFSASIDAARGALPRVRLWLCIETELAAWTDAQPSTKPQVEYGMDDVVAPLARRRV